VRRTARNLVVLTVAGSLAVVFGAPSPAQAKADYAVEVSGRNLAVGSTVTVTVTMDNDGGIDDGARMCLFRIVGPHAPRPQNVGSLTEYTIAPGSRLVKVADCQRPAPDAEWAGSPDHYSGTTRYRLRVSSGGWLAFEAVLQENGTRVDIGGPIVSNVVRVGGSGGAESGAAGASLLSMDPAHEPTVGPTAGPAEVGGTPSARGTLDAPAAAAGHSTGPPSSGGPGAESAARGGRPKVRWLAGAVVGGLLLGGLVVGLTLILRPRTRTKRP